VLLHPGHSVGAHVSNEVDLLIVGITGNGRAAIGRGRRGNEAPLYSSLASPLRIDRGSPEDDGATEWPSGKPLYV